jgi:hypothetical protein
MATPATTQTFTMVRHSDAGNEAFLAQVKKDFEMSYVLYVLPKDYENKKTYTAEDLVRLPNILVVRKRFQHCDNCMKRCLMPVEQTVFFYDENNNAQDFCLECFRHAYPNTVKVTATLTPHDPTA